MSVCDGFSWATVVTLVYFCLLTFGRLECRVLGSLLLIYYIRFLQLYLFIQGLILLCLVFIFFFTFEFCSFLA
uniref:Uncharacterized protein n=1 Tax=Rhizophora mucronata TaxID=61149 RepID=A0A2P2KLD5_RHIMU